MREKEKRAIGQARLEVARALEQRGRVSRRENVLNLILWGRHGRMGRPCLTARPCVLFSVQQPFCCCVAGGSGLQFGTVGPCYPARPCHHLQHTKQKSGLLIFGPPVQTGTGPRTEYDIPLDRGPDRIASVRSGPVRPGPRSGPGLDRITFTRHYMGDEGGMKVSVDIPFG